MNFDLTTHSVFGAMLKLGIPAVLAALFDEINWVIDTIFMGRFIGAEAVASMSIVLPFLIFASALSLLFGDGASISMSRYLGAGNSAGSSKAASLSIKITLFTSIILGLLSFFLAPGLIEFFRLEEQTYIYSVKYIRYYSLGLPVFLFPMLILKILYIEVYAKTILYLTMLQVGTNIVLNSVFLGLFSWGVGGAVAGTLLSFLLQGGMAYRSFIMKHTKTKLVKAKFDKAYFTEVIPLGMPTFFTMLLLAVTMTVQGKVIAHYGSYALGVETIFANVFSISSSAAAGIMNAALVLMSYSVGAGNKKRFMAILKKSTVVVLSSSLVISLPLISFPGIIGSIFTDSTEIRELFVFPAIMLGVTSPFIFTTNTLLYAMQPIGMEKASAVVFALQQLGLYLPLIYFLKDMSYVHAIAAQPAAEVIGGVMTLMLIPRFMKVVTACFAAKAGNESLSPFEVPEIKRNVTTKEILEDIRETRELS
jgi:putative MATE family efflux protein